MSIDSRSQNCSVLSFASTALAVRHPMHVIWQDYRSGGELWLGGIGASGELTVLLDNGITGIWPAASNPP